MNVPTPHRANPQTRPCDAGRYYQMKSLMRRVLLAAPLAVVFLASPSAAAPQPWVVAPASDGAEIISQLFWFTLVLATIVFVLVEGLLIYSSLRFRRRAPLPFHEPPQIHGNTRLEVMWATVPALILVGLFGITVSRLGDMSQLPTDANTLHISVTGRQFQWEFGYGTSGVKTTNDLHIPVGTPLIFDVTSLDVIHSFWVPDLYGKIDANPGRVNRITFKAPQPRTYRAPCGAPPPPPLLLAPATPPDPAAPADPATIDAGKALIAQKGCGACHTIAGIPGAQGQIGPNLAGVASRPRIAGGAVPNNGPDDLKR